MRAFGTGVVAGLGIAVPVGAIAVLIVDLGVRRGFRPAFAAGLGAASADLLYASLAAVAGVAAASLLEPVADDLRLVSAAVLLTLAAYRTWRLVRPGPIPDRSAEGPERAAGATELRTYTAFLGLTLLNPMTVAYFAALIVGLQAGVASDTAGKALFTLGAFAASASWQTGLAGAGALLHHRLPSRTSLMTGLVGNLVVLGFAIRLALTS